ncbi:MAG: hypothetical protein KDA58_10865 [Planctomycetaceae bacterium]|nr:hypothetical protein [Planctomycetaceae bacterium]
MLYLGDTSLTTAASYLAGVLHRAGYAFEYRSSDHVLTPADLVAASDLLILSDYPASRISTAVQEELVRRHQAGMSLLMIGGWESFQGCGGDWAGTPLGTALPVLMQSEDDRQNVDGPAFVHCEQPHSITAGLPWAERPPLIGGYNRVVAQPDAHVLLSVERFTAKRTPQGYQLERLCTDPLLVIHEAGNARSAALTTDLAPHWVGPLVDWGPNRVQAQAPGAEAIEVGDLYAKLIQQLIAWLI